MNNEETARDFVLGNLSPAERAEVSRARLSNSALDEAIERAEAALSPIAAGATDMTPPAGLWDKLKLSITTQEATSAGRSSVLFDEGHWHDYSPGIRAKRLWSKKTFFLRCEPGAVLPEHRHEEDEHLTVVSGDFIMSGFRYKTGDYLLAKAGSLHEVAHTDQGCILLVQYAA